MFVINKNNGAALMTLIKISFWAGSLKLPL